MGKCSFPRAQYYPVVVVQSWKNTHISIFFPYFYFPTLTFIATTAFRSDIQPGDRLSSIFPSF